MLYRGDHFHPPLQVAQHQICRTDKVFRLIVVAEVVDTGMLQKTANNGNHPDVFGNSLDARADKAAVADDEIYLDPDLGGFVQGLDNVVIGERIALELDVPALALGLVFHFAFDFFKQGLFQKFG